MNRFALLAAALMLGAATGPSPIEARIEKLEKTVNEAYAANDLSTYFAFYAPDLRALYPEGPTSLPEYKKSWSAFIQSGGRIESFTYDKMRIQVSPAGDSAVASYQAEARTRNADKTVVDEHFNETDVWFLRRGAWKIVETHYSKIDAKP